MCNSIFSNIVSVLNDYQITRPNLLRINIIWKLLAAFCEVEIREAQGAETEMLYLVCKFRFQPVFMRITTVDNDIADHISRVHDPETIDAKFKSRGLHSMKEVVVPDGHFDFVADW